MTTKTRGRFMQPNRRKGDRPSARENRQVANMLNNARGEGGISVRVDRRGLVVDGSGLASTGGADSFRVTKDSGNNALVQQGFIHYPGATVNPYHIPEVTADDAIKIEGGPFVWVCAFMHWGNHDDRGIMVQAGADFVDDCPTADATIYRRPLRCYQFVSDGTPTGGVFTPYWVHHLGDIEIVMGM